MYRMNQISPLKAEARIAARLAKKHGLTQSSIAAALNVSQSQVSRVLSGESKRRSRLFNEVCKYVKLRATPTVSSNPRDSPELMSALAEVWDGSLHHAEALAIVIRSLGGLAPVAVQSSK